MPRIPRQSTTAEVADALGVTTHTVNRYCRNGTIPFRVDRNGQRRFNLDEVRASLNQRTPAPPPSTPGNASPAPQSRLAGDDDKAAWRRFDRACEHLAASVLAFNAGLWDPAAVLAGTAAREAWLVTDRYRTIEDNPQTFAGDDPRVLLGVVTGLADVAAVDHRPLDADQADSALRSAKKIVDAAARALP